MKIKYFLIVGIFLLIVIPVFLFFISKNFINKNSLKPIPAPQPTSISTKLDIISISPSNNAINIGIYPSIIVRFSRIPTPVEKSLIKISGFPSIDGEQKWLPDQKSLLLTPSKPLRTNQKYLLKVNSPLETYRWEFTTISVENVPLEDQIKNQTEADRNFAEWQKNIYKNYPWYDSFPIRTTNYFVYFDIEKKGFIAKLYPKTDSPISINEQTVGLKNEILEKLKNLNIDTTKYTIHWDIVPKP